MTVNPMVNPISELYADFNEIELNRLIELRRAARNAIDKPLNKITNEYQQKVIDAFLKNAITCEDVVKLMAIYFEQNVQKSITFGKNLSAFKSLCENDQVALIKYGGIEICSIRSVRYFNFEEQYWTLIVVRDLFLN